MSSNSAPNRNILPGIFLIQAEIILQFSFPMETFFELVEARLTIL